MSPGRTPARLAADGVATSAATTPTARSTHSTPSSTSFEAARDTTLASPSASRPSVTATGSAVCLHSRHHDSRSYTGMLNSLAKLEIDPRHSEQTVYRGPRRLERANLLKKRRL